MGVRRTQEEIDEVMNQAAEAMDQGTKWLGMSYEEGVHNALLWVIGDREDSPMEDE